MSKNEEQNKTSDEIQLEGFQDFWLRLIGQCKSCLERDVLRNQKAAIKEEWMKVKPWIDGNTYTRNSLNGRVE